MWLGSGLYKYLNSLNVYASWCNILTFSVVLNCAIVYLNCEFNDAIFQNRNLFKNYESIIVQFSHQMCRNAKQPGRTIPAH